MKVNRFSGSAKNSQPPDENNIKVNKGNYSNQYQVDDFVMVKYGAKQYPGKIINIDGAEICVSEY